MSGRHRSRSDVVADSLPRSEHLLQIYETERVFLDTLEGFSTGGLRAGEGVIVIATGAHIDLLEARLRASTIDLEAARSSEQYASVDAEDLLSQFMVDGWPDKNLFQRLIGRLLTSARGPGRKVRAFGEMVAVLWARGDHGATIRLEYLWHQLCETEGFSLLCAYPRAGFAGDAGKTISELVALHSDVAPARPPSRIGEIRWETGEKRRSD